MATADPSASTLTDAVEPTAIDSLTNALGAVGTAAQGAAFWSGITLAFAQVPLLVADVTASRPTLLVALLVANVVAMALGSGYRA
ncbi:hypothetical protein [Halosegnis marinus]|uniref:MFS transporter n=1 Tax=Halosegnis marinus TaxID=3034023 RepID=A0ABD5ZPG6_9EURY|nr:hypothetical protein [Halosegnis sp. DT85]